MSRAGSAASDVAPSRNGHAAHDDGDDGLDVKFSEVTEKAIEGMCRTELCRPDLELTAQINQLFPTEQSLTQLDHVESELLDLDVELAELVEAHGQVGLAGVEALTEAHSAMSELQSRVHEIREQTQASESVVREMTRDVQQLDVAKRNLTAAITTLHHLHILLTGVESLGYSVFRLFIVFRHMDRTKAIWGHRRPSPSCSQCSSAL